MFNYLVIDSLATLDFNISNFHLAECVESKNKIENMLATDQLLGFQEDKVVFHYTKFIATAATRYHNKIEDSPLPLFLPPLK